MEHGRDSVDQCQERHVPSRRYQAVGHLPCHHAAEAIAGEDEWTTGERRLQRVQVPCSQVLDALAGRLVACQANRLDRVDRLVGAETPGERPEAQNVAVQPVDDYERRTRTVDSERHDQVGAGILTLAIDAFGQERNGRGRDQFAKLQASSEVLG